MYSHHYETHSSEFELPSSPAAVASRKTIVSLQSTRTMEWSGSASTIWYPQGLLLGQIKKYGRLSYENFLKMGRAGGFYFYFLCVAGMLAAARLPLTHLLTTCCGSTTDMRNTAIADCFLLLRTVRSSSRSVDKNNLTKATASQASSPPRAP